MKVFGNGDWVVIYAVPTLEGRPLEDRQDLRRRLSTAALDALSHMKALKAVRLVKEIPRSGSGKVLSSQLGAHLDVGP